jgi:CheY-like chemotaxis protein
VLVLDISMPWLDGFEATRRLRRQVSGGLRIVGVSAHAGSAERTQALAAGMDVFLVKPVQMAALVEAISAASTQGIRTRASQMPTLEHLRALFAREALQLRAEIQAAASAHDPERLRARVHYLKNSADIARYDELSLRCSQLESILQAGGADADRLVLEIDRDLSALSNHG